MKLELLVSFLDRYTFLNLAPQKYYIESVTIQKHIHFLQLSHKVPVLQIVLVVENTCEVNLNKNYWHFLVLIDLMINRYLTILTLILLKSMGSCIILAEWNGRQSCRQRGLQGNTLQLQRIKTKLKNKQTKHKQTKKPQPKPTNQPTQQKKTIKPTQKEAQCLDNRLIGILERVFIKEYLSSGSVV